MGHVIKERKILGQECNTPAINPGKMSTSVGPKPLKRSNAFSGSGGLSRNWRAKINHSKHL
jgi:hypothetical protein